MDLLKYENSEYAKFQGIRVGSELTIDNFRPGKETASLVGVSVDCQANQHESRFALFDSYAMGE
jgi:hypothetical protein